MIKHSAITFLYQFLAEAIIVFILILPITFEYYESAHYIGYTIIIFSVGVCFFLLETYKQPSFAFLTGVPLGIVLLYVFQFPVALIFFFPLVFVWRYVKIRSYERNEQRGLYLHVLDGKYERNFEKIYLHVTIVLSMIVVIYSKEIYVVFYTFLQFFILFIGFTVSHMAVIKGDERKHIKGNVFVFMPIAFGIAAIVFFQYFNEFRLFTFYVWKTIISSFIFLAGFVARLVGYMIPGIRPPELSEGEREGSFDIQDWENTRLFGLEHREGIDEHIFVMIVSVIMIGVVALLLYRSFRQRREQAFAQVDQTVTHHELQKMPKERGLFESLVNKVVRKPGDPVRDLVYDFERRANKKGLGRYPFETIEDWFRRMNIDVTITTYQKVRYGEKNVDEEKVAELKKQLKKVEETFKSLNS